MRWQLIPFVAAAPVAVLVAALATSLASGTSSPVPRSGMLTDAQDGLLFKVRPT